MPTVTSTLSRFAARPISLDSYRVHCKQDHRWITKQGLTPTKVTAVFNGLVSGPLLGYIIKCRSSYVGVAVTRTNRYTRLTHRTVKSVADWLTTGKEI